LEFPLSQHYFGINAGDSQTGVKAGVEMLFNDVSAGDVMIAHGAIIRSLWLGITTVRKAYRTAVIGHEHILLLKTKPIIILVLIIN
jgi:hypothetical protein